MSEQTITLDVAPCPSTSAIAAMFTDGNVALISFLTGVVLVAVVVGTAIVRYRAHERKEKVELEQLRTGKRLEDLRKQASS